MCQGSTSPAGPVIPVGPKTSWHPVLFSVLCQGDLVLSSMPGDLAMAGVIKAQRHVPFPRDSVTNGSHVTVLCSQLTVSASSHLRFCSTESSQHPVSPSATTGATQQQLTRPSEPELRLMDPQERQRHGR